MFLKKFVFIDKFCSTLRDVNIGAPQGSNFWPLLFLLYINDLPNSVDYVPQLFADDRRLLVHSSFLNHLECKFNIGRNNLNNWIISNKLTLNVKK